MNEPDSAIYNVASPIHRAVQMAEYMIQTKRLGLRFLVKGDLDNLVALNADPDVKQFFPEGTQNREQTGSRIKDFISYHKKKGLPCFVVFELETKEFIGRAGFTPMETGEIDVGYLLQKKFWGNGYASEALEALLRWAETNINADYIIAFTPIEHLASQRVMQKCGMENYKNDLVKGVACCFYRKKNR